MSAPLESLARRIEHARGLAGPADRVRESAHDTLVSNERLDWLLGGDWLGHRVHPVAAQVPMGAFMMATLLDLAGTEEHARAVDALTLVGILSALPTALTGAHDLATTDGGATRVALVHAAGMDATLLLFLAAHHARRRGDRRKGRRRALLGTAVASGSAYLGGHMVYRLGVGVRP